MRRVSWKLGELGLQLRHRANEWMKAEANAMLPGRNLHGAEQHVGLEDLGRRAVDLCPPPGMPHVVEQQETAGRGVDVDDDLGIAVADDADGAAVRVSGRRSCRGRPLEQ